MRRLYLQIYAGLVGIVVVFALLVHFAAVLRPATHHERELMDGVRALLGEIVPPPGASADEMSRVAERLGRAALGDVALYDAGGTLLGSAGRPPRLPRQPRSALQPRRGGYRLVAELPDGRWLVVQHRGTHEFRALTVVLLLAMAGAMALGAYPLARRIAGRLERLRRGVESLAAGDLGARVVVEGRDEVADLARSFNHAAERIEKLVAGERALLASASHELRTPLARIRMALEFLPTAGRETERRQIEHDIAELDAMIEEILLASRLEASAGVERHDDIDLLALLAEEGARVGATVAGVPTRIRGDGLWLRRLLRNLFENARRYGGGSAIEGELDRTADGDARLRIGDRGPGVPADERQRIFEPFYRASTHRDVPGGTGLGLALVRRIARLHGGDADYQARAGGGSVVEVRLPLASPA